MAQTVNLPVVATASPVGAPATPQNSAVNQGGTTSFSGLLALLGDSATELPVSPELAQLEGEGGQDLPLETLGDGKGGNLLPPLMEPTNPQLATSVTSAMHATLLKEPTSGGVIDSSVPEADTAPVPELASQLTVEPTATALQPIGAALQPAKQTVLQALAAQEAAANSQQPQQSSARILMQNSDQFRAPSREANAAQAHFTHDPDVPELPVQSIRSLPEEIVKSPIRSADVAVAAQHFRRLMASVPGNEARNSHEITSLLSAVQSTPTASSQSNIQQLPSLTLDTPFLKTGWDQGLTDKIQWMTAQKLQAAEIKLNPAHLGPMAVKIQLQNDQASVQFTAAHGVVRDALEAAIPRLREMFESQGIQLADVDVSEHSFARQRKDREAQPSWQADSAVEEKLQQSHEDISSRRWTTAIPMAGRLDLFA